MLLTVRRVFLKCLFFIREIPYAARVPIIVAIIEERIASTRVLRSAKRVAPSLKSSLYHFNENPEREFVLFEELNENSISYSKALQSAVDKSQEFFTKHSTKKTFNGEIIIRLLCENERNYYYVSIISESGEKISYLINATSGEIIAHKIN